jgi:hypothetical protein
VALVQHLLQKLAVTPEEGLVGQRAEALAVRVVPTLARQVEPREVAEAGLEILAQDHLITIRWAVDRLLLGACRFVITETDLVDGVASGQIVCESAS